MKGVFEKLPRQALVHQQAFAFSETPNQEFFKVTSESPHGHSFFEEKECGHKGRANRHAGASDRYFERLLGWRVSLFEKIEKKKGVLEFQEHPHSTQERLPCQEGIGSDISAMCSGSTPGTLATDARQQPLTRLSLSL